MHIKIEYSGAGCIFLALLCLVLPLDWLLAAIMAAAFHELCHIVPVWFMGGKIHSLQLHQWGAVMEASVMEPWQEILCILAGPAGSMILLTLSRFTPRIALCGLVQGLFNLMPVYPLDGGRALFCLTGMLLSPSAADRVCRAAGWISYAVICAAGVYATFIAKAGMFPLLAVILFLTRMIQGKIPCKESKVGVQ